MPSYSILIITFVMFSGLISGFSNVHRLGIRSDSISQSNSEYLSTSSNKTPLSRYGKRGFLRRLSPQPGIKCDSSFYKQAKLEQVVERACRDEVFRSYAKPTRNRFSSSYKLPRYDFPKTSLFPHEDGHLTMIRIVGDFFSSQNLRAFLRIGKVDYVVFAGACKSVGIVRQTSKNEFELCKPVYGGWGKMSIKCNGKKLVRNARNQIGYLQFLEVTRYLHHHTTISSPASIFSPTSSHKCTTSKFIMENIGITNSLSRTDESYPLIESATSQSLL